LDESGVIAKLREHCGSFSDDVDLKVPITLAIQ